MKDVNGVLLIHDEGQLKEWKEDFTILNRITSDEVACVVSSQYAGLILSQAKNLVGSLTWYSYAL